VLRRDPEYQRRALDDGHTVEEHFAAWNDYFRFWLKTFATHGLWVELGSDTYRKYSYSTLLNLYDLAPDPEVRKLAGMFLDLALIEESQMTFADGFRGGGRSRVSYSASLAKGSSSGDLGRSGFESILSLFFGDDKGGATHSRVFETSAYPAPDVAILLRFRGPRDYPLMIRNRVPGELAETPSSDGATYALNFDSGLVNLCFRSPYYMLGSTLQDPRASYSAISSQNRWSGMVFDDRARSRIIPHPEPTRPGSTRTHDAYWSVQHRNVMIVQKTKKAKYMRAMRVFVSPGLERVERDGRVFVSDGRAHAMIVPAIGGYPGGVDGKGPAGGPGFRDDDSRRRIRARDDSRRRRGRPWVIRRFSGPCRGHAHPA